MKQTKDNIICFGIKYDIDYVASLDRLAGEILFDSKKITVVKDADYVKQMNTIIHESLHALFYRLEMYQIITREVEELLTSNIPNFLLENFDIKLRKKKIIYSP
jgi:hypothetical protein